MAESRYLDLGALWEPVCRHDPATGKLTCYLRRTHNLSRSVRLAGFRRCVGDLTRGRRYRGEGAAADERMTRAALTAAARTCARRV